MTTLTSLARAQAVVRGAAQPITTVRHAHISDSPLVLIPLGLAGEANAPLATMVGTSRDAAALLVVAQARSRDQRFAYAASLAQIVLNYVDECCRRTETVPGEQGRTDQGRTGQRRTERSRFRDAPQILVPNGGGVGFVRLLGRSTRFRRTHGEFAVAESVPVLGRWLTFLGERTEHPGSCLLLALTDVLCAHWATGQSLLEDQNLATLLAWADPPPGSTGAEAAAAAEDPLTCPPAGPATDPSFDNDVLAPLVARYGASGADEPARRRVVAAIEAALASQVEPTWRLMWRAVDLLRAMPAGAHVAERWARDRDAFTEHVEHLRAGGAPQPRRDGAVAAARRLSWLERAQAGYEAQRAFDDPLVMAEHRLTGEAFAGVVVSTEPGRVDASGPRRKLRPHVTVETDDLVRLRRGTPVAAPTRSGQKAVVVSVAGPMAGPVAGSAAGSVPDPVAGWRVVVELSGGMGRSLTPAPGSVPEIGERICYTTLTDAYQPAGVFPAREDTPWTHGGPPVDYVPTDGDAREDWS